jgi:hypothetical protein
MVSYKALIINMLMIILVCSCVNKDTYELNPEIRNAIERAVIEYVWGDTERSVNLIVFEKKYNDEIISIYEYSANFENNIDTLKCNLITKMHNRTVLIVDNFVKPNKIFLGSKSSGNDFILNDSPEALIVINNETGQFKIINFGQKFIPFIQKICEAQSIINEMRTVVVL